MTTVRIEANLMGTELRARASGATLAHAVRNAVRELKLGPGRTVRKSRVSAGLWEWDWSGHALTVRVLGVSGPSGAQKPRALRPNNGGRRRIELTLLDDVVAAIDAEAAIHGSRSAAVEHVFAKDQKK